MRCMVHCNKQDTKIRIEHPKNRNILHAPTRTRAAHHITPFLTWMTLMRQTWNKGG